MNDINTSSKRIHSLLILTFLCFLILINKTYSEEKIGTVVALTGEIIAINSDDEKRTLGIYDDILLFDEIVTDNSSSATVQYDDNSTVIIKSLSSFKITEFVFSIAKKKFLGIVKKGKIIIESGKIAKAQKGSMEVQLPTMILGIRGTRFNMKINPDGTSEVGLSEDSFGNVGTINISSEGKVKTLYETDQVISANIETKKDSNETFLDKSKEDEIISKIKFYQDENTRLSSEIIKIKKNYETIKENFADVENQKNDIFKKIKELNNSLIKNNIVGTPFIKETIEEDSISSKILNDITNKNLNKEKKKTEKNNNLDEAINNIFK